MCIQYTYVYKNIIFDDNDNGDNDDKSYLYFCIMDDDIDKSYENGGYNQRWVRVPKFSTRVSSSTDIQYSSFLEYLLKHSSITRVFTCE